MEIAIYELIDITYPDKLFHNSRDSESLEYHIGIRPSLPLTFSMK